MDANHVLAWSKGEATNIKIAKCYIKDIIVRKGIDNLDDVVCLVLNLIGKNLTRF